MSCKYTINTTGEEFTLWAFDDFLKAMEPSEAAKWMAGINAVANPEASKFSIRSSIEDAVKDNDAFR
jgi:hypothetical protein